MFRSRRSQIIFKTIVIKKFVNFTEKTSPEAASASLRFPDCNFVKKENPAKMFSCEFYRIFQNIFWLNTSGWLLFVFIWEFWEAFQKTSFIEQLISNFNHQIQQETISQVLFKDFMQERQVAIRKNESEKILKIPENYL